MTRKRIPVGAFNRILDRCERFAKYAAVGLIVYMAVCIVLTCTTAYGSERFGAVANATSSPLVLPHASGNGWSVDIRGTATTGGTLTLADCSNGYSQTLAPGEPFDVKDAGGWFCASFGTFVVPDGIDATAILKFAPTGQSFAVPPLGSIQPDATETFLAINDGDSQTCVVTFAPSDQSMSAAFHDPAGVSAGGESFTVKAGADLHCFADAPAVGTVDLTVVGGWGSGTSGPEAVPGFVTIGNPAGGNAQVLPFK